MPTGTIKKLVSDRGELFAPHGRAANMRPIHSAFACRYASTGTTRPKSAIHATATYHGAGRIQTTPTRPDTAAPYVVISIAPVNSPRPGMNGSAHASHASRTSVTLHHARLRRPAPHAGHRSRRARATDATLPLGGVGG